MNTLSITPAFTRQTGKRSIPSTPRGRALYTTAWFLNGTPRMTNYDYPVKTVQGGLPC